MFSVNSWLGHWYLARARRAELRAISLKKKAEKFFHKLRRRSDRSE